MSLDDMISVLQDAKAGKNIQFRAIRDGSAERWHDMALNYRASVSWNFNACEYRVRPEPREWTIAIDSFGCLRNAGEIPPPAREYVRVREVGLNSPPTPREWYAYVTPDGELLGRTDATWDRRRHGAETWREIKVREILNEQPF
jgi:hypothetical protein